MICAIRSVPSNVAQLLQSGRLDDGGIKKFASTLMNTYGRMIGLIDNLMDFANGRLGSGIVIHPEWLHIGGPLLHVIDELQLIWPERTIEIKSELDTAVFADEKRIIQLLSNLLSNALTHGSAGTVVRITLASNEQQFTMNVSNNGEVIQGTILKSIFEPFSRGAAGRRGEGLGLGLFISSEIAKAHRGTFTVTSTLAETSFTFAMSYQGVN